MGFFDVFKPAWKKSPEAALESIQVLGVPNKIIAIMKQTDFPEEAMVYIRFKGIEKLNELQKRVYLGNLPPKGWTALVRCQIRAYEGLSWEKEELKEAERELEKIRDPYFWLDFAMLDYPGAPDIVKKLPNDLLAKALLSDNSDVRKYAAEHLDFNSLNEIQKKCFGDDVVEILRSKKNLRELRSIFEAFEEQYNKNPGIYPYLSELDGLRLYFIEYRTYENNIKKGDIQLSIRHKYDFFKIDDRWI